jgi:hypothetical protein
MSETESQTAADSRVNIKCSKRTREELKSGKRENESWDEYLDRLNRYRVLAQLVTDTDN